MFEQIKLPYAFDALSINILAFYSAGFLSQNMHVTQI